MQNHKGIRTFKEPHLFYGPRICQCYKNKKYETRFEVNQIQDTTYSFIIWILSLCDDFWLNNAIDQWLILSMEKILSGSYLPG